jgi:translation elongation factor EF-Tu-like GTPase
MKVAIFEIIDTFRITGRGGVLVGNIIDGVINKNNLIDILDKKIIIKNIECIIRRNTSLPTEMIV